MPPQERLTKDDWLQAAMERLRTRGIGGVRVLTLAQDLGVSRGSFYWHFADHGALLDGMLDWWEREMTDAVIERAKTAKGGAGSRLRRAAETIVANDLARYDSAIRSWGEGDAHAKRVLRRVIKKRLDYITSLFAEAGFPPGEARARGDLLAVYLMSESAVHMDEPIETRLRWVRRHVRALTS